VVYVHRPVEQATLSAVLRYIEGKHGEERAVPIHYLALKHYQSQRVVLALLDMSMVSQHMSTTVVNNSGFNADSPPEFLKAQAAIDFLRRPATFYANEHDAYNRAYTAYGVIARLLPANAQSAFDPQAGAGAIHGPHGTEDGRKLEAQSDETIPFSLVSALDGLRIKHSQAPSDGLLREADRLCDELPDNRLAISKFKAAASDYVAGKIGPVEMKAKTLEYGWSIARRFKLPQVQTQKQSPKVRP